MIDYDKLKKIPDELKHVIIKEHMKTYYHWTVGILCFLLGTFFGLLIKQGLAPVAKLVKAPNS